MRHAQEVFNPLTQGLPSAEESERFLLGACLQYGKFAECEPRVSEEFFSSETHRVIWRAMTAVSGQKSAVDHSTVAIWFSKRLDELERAGGLGYIVDLADGSTGASIDSYVREIRDCHYRRLMMFKFNEAMMRLGDRTQDTVEIGVDVGEEIQKCVGSVAERSGFSTVKEVIMDAGGLDKYLNRRRQMGLRYPWEEMNRLTLGGMRPGNLIVLAGPSGGGKTALALNCAVTAAAQGAGVAMFSLEMDREEISDRLISIAGKIDGRVLRRDFENPDARFKIRQSVSLLADNPIIFVHDETSPSIKSVRSELKRLMAKESIGLVIVDYIQLVEGSIRKGSTRAEDVGHITRGLKRMASELKVPVIALSQLNRDSAKDNRPPELHDLRESGSIEQDASLVAMIHFTRRYDTGAGVDTGDLDLLIRKQRNGPVGSISLEFHAPSGLFDER